MAARDSSSSADTALISSLNTLIASLVPALPAEDATHHDRLLHLCLRIVSSRIASNAAPSDSAAAEATRRRLVQSGRGSDALAYSELHARLLRAADLRRPSAALQLLAALLDTNKSNSASVGPALLSRPPLALADGVTTRAPEASIVNTAASRDLPPRVKKDPSGGSGPANSDGGGRPPKRSVTPWNVGGGGGTELGEKALVRELLFVLQNIDGAHLKWDVKLDSFVLPSGAKVPPGARQLVGRLAELGWLFRQVTYYVKAGGGGGEQQAASTTTNLAATVAGGTNAAVIGFERGESSVRAEGGLVAQALRHALQEELDSWYQLLAVLEEQRQSELTLLQLLVWSAEPMQRLLLMAQLTRGCGHLKGGAMTVAIQRQENHGDPQISGYVRQLLTAACKPLFTMTREWILHGEITDSYDEFFIEQRAVPLSGLWEERYVLREGMLPCFLSRALAIEILKVGKALNFIRLCCNDTDWSLRLNAPLKSEMGGGGAAGGAGGSSATTGAGPNAGTVMARLEYGREAELQSVVTRASALASTHLLDLLMNRFDLRAHCYNTQQYLLLGKGDFVQSLMEHLAPQLARPATQLHRHHLLSLVESAVRSSATSVLEGSGGGGGGGGNSVEQQHSFLLKSLDVTLSKVPGGSGWDCFCLDYSVGAPCDVVFSSAAMRSYRQASTFLWRLKRVEHSLTAVWRKHCTTARLIPKLHSNATMHKCYLLRNEMVHFVYNLQYARYRYHQHPLPTFSPSHPSPSPSSPGTI